MTIARTQAYALRQLDALAGKLERETKMGDLADAAKEVEAKVEEWLAVLARCFQLQDAIAVLELDRVLDASPDELDRHRLALRTARDNRMVLISRSTAGLMARMDAAAGTANSKVLLTRPSHATWCAPATMSPPPSSTSTGRLGSEAAAVPGGETMEGGGHGREGQRSRERARAEWMSPGASAARPSTGPGR